MSTEIKTPRTVASVDIGKSVSRIWTYPANVEKESDTEDGNPVEVGSILSIRPNMYEPMYTNPVKIIQLLYHELLKSSYIEYERALTTYLQK